MQVYRRTTVWAFTAQSHFPTVIMTRGCTVVKKKSVDSYVWFDFFCHSRAMFGLLSWNVYYVLLVLYWALHTVVLKK